MRLHAFAVPAVSLFASLWLLGGWGEVPSAHAEGSRELVARARQNAAANDLVAQFEVLDLFKSGIGAFGPFSKILIDPPREGAVELAKSLPAQWPQRLLYVSCDPATLARDAGILVHTKGFRLASAGVVNMFPHTAHVESVALFER